MNKKQTLKRKHEREAKNAIRRPTMDIIAIREHFSSPQWNQKIKSFSICYGGENT